MKITNIRKFRKGKLGSNWSGGGMDFSRNIDHCFYFNYKIFRNNCKKSCCLINIKKALVIVKISFQKSKVVFEWVYRKISKGSTYIKSNINGLLQFFGKHLSKQTRLQSPTDCIFGFHLLQYLLQFIANFSYIYHKGLGCKWMQIW